MHVARSSHICKSSSSLLLFFPNAIFSSLSKISMVVFWRLMVRSRCLTWTQRTALLRSSLPSFSEVWLSSMQALFTAYTILCLEISNKRLSDRWHTDFSYAVVSTLIRWHSFFLLHQFEEPPWWWRSIFLPSLRFSKLFMSHWLWLTWSRLNMAKRSSGWSLVVARGCDLHLLTLRYLKVLRFTFKSALW